MNTRKRPSHTLHSSAPARGAALRAFTLIEVLVVVIVIGVLATLILPNIFGRVGQAKQSVAKQKLANIEQAVQIFHYDYGRFPETLDELVARPADIDEATWKPPTLKERDLVDPWGNPWQYQVPGDNGAFDLYSLGADGQEGGEEDNADITNW